MRDPHFTPARTILPIAERLTWVLNHESDDEQWRVYGPYRAIAVAVLPPDFIEPVEPAEPWMRDVVGETRATRGPLLMLLTDGATYSTICWEESFFCYFTEASATRWCEDYNNGMD